jgi:hypothetical protein
VTTSAINDLPEVPADKPPPGYTEFYGWYRGNFYGLKAKNWAEVTQYRAEGRWFDEHGREIPRYLSDGSYNHNGGNLDGEPHADRMEAAREDQAANKIVFWVYWVPILVVAGIFALIANGILTLP